MLQQSYTIPVEKKVWFNAGLEFLYIPSDERREELSTKKTPAKSVTTAKVNTSQVTQVSAVAQGAQQNSFQAKSTHNNIQQNRVTTQKKSSIIESPRSSQEAREIEENNRKSIYPLPILKEFEWSDTWKELYKKIIRHEKPKLAWTYTGFYADLMKNENVDPKRQELVRSLIRKLNRPNGTHVFIPYDTPHKVGELFEENGASFYWSVIAHLKIRNLLVFGSETRDTLLLPSRGRYSSFYYNGHKIYVLPDLNKIEDLANQDALYNYLDKQLLSVNI